MEEFPSNSRTDKEATDEKPKKIEPVATEGVKRRKKPLRKRFGEIFLGDDAKSAGEYVMMDVLLPAARDAVADAVSQGVERMIYGEARTSRHRPARPSSTTPGSYINYRGYSSGSRPAPREDPRRQLSREARSRHEFDEIILATRVEAEEVIDRMYDLVDRYGSASVADLYDLVGVSSNSIDYKWGWTDVQGSQVRRIRDGYLLDFPHVESLRS